MSNDSDKYYEYYPVHYPNLSVQYGWICPKCGVVNAPWISECPYCGTRKTRTNYEGSD